MAIGDKLKDFIHSIDLPKVETDVEVKPSTSLIYVVFGGLILAYLLFKRK